MLTSLKQASQHCCDYNRFSVHLLKNFRKLELKAQSLSTKLAEKQASTLLASKESPQHHKQPEERSALQNFLRHGARVTRAAHSLLADVVQPGDVVVDATCGGGHDTLFWCRAVGPTGRVIAFDVQTDAIEATTNLLEWELPEEQRPTISILQKCHTQMKEELNGLAPKLVCFNLGYLPFTDKTVMTLPETTVAAIEVALEVLDKDGALSIISYVGHEGGLAEYDAVAELLSQLDSHQWTVVSTKILNRPLAPVLFIAARKC